MEMVTYQQAAEILEVQYNTIKIAVHNGRLTRCSTGTRHALLLRAQVELFLGKHGISEIYLTKEEKVRWEKYKELAEASSNEKQADFSTIRETIETMVSNQSKLGEELLKMQRAYEAMKDCMNEIENLIIKSGSNVPDEMKKSFPHLTLTQERA